MFVLSKIYTTQNAVTTLFYHTMYFGTVTRRSEVSLLLLLGQVPKNRFTGYLTRCQWVVTSVTGLCHPDDRTSMFVSELVDPLTW